MSFNSFVKVFLEKQKEKSSILFIKRDTCAAGAHMIKEMGIHQIRHDLIQSLQWKDFDQYSTFYKKIQILTNTCLLLKKENISFCDRK